MRNRVLKLLLVGVIALQMCASSAVLAAGEVNLCGTYADIKEGGSILAYSDGSFTGEASRFTADTVSEGFGYLKVGSDNYAKSTTTEGTLTYPLGVGGRASEDRSAKLTAFAADATLAIGNLKADGGLDFNQYDVGTTSVLVIDADFLMTGMKERKLTFYLGNSYKWMATLNFEADGDISVQYYIVEGSKTVSKTAETDMTYSENEWYRVKIVKDIAGNKDYVYINGKKACEYSPTSLAGNGNNAKLSYVTFTQTKGTADAPASMYVDDVEIYVANSLDSALSTDKTLATDLASTSDSCTVDNTNDTIAYTSTVSPANLSDLKAVITGNIAGILKDGNLVTDGNLADGDTIVVLSEDGRTFRYYSLTLTINLPNLLGGAELIVKDPASGAKINNVATVATNMFDGDAETYLKTWTNVTEGTYILDLKEKKSFNRVSLYKPNDQKRSFKLTVQVSDDKSNWVDVMSDAEVPATNGTEIIYDIPKASGQYVKFYIHDISPENGYSGFAISEVGLYYDAGLPKMTSYRCLLSKNIEDVTKLNARVEASAAIGEGFGGILIGAVYDNNWKMLKATVLDDEFNVSANSEFSETYPMDFITGAKYAKVFLWNSLSDMMPLYGYSDYSE
ncbi:MAG: discoidin domain-containing protein [Clostridia bacterium]|nr:discoidin domain-containing protein [Clostridia bacterium]